MDTRTCTHHIPLDHTTKESRLPPSAYRAKHSTCWPANTKCPPLWGAIMEADGCHGGALRWWRGQCAEADESAPSERWVKQWNWPELLVRELQTLATASVCVCFCGWGDSGHLSLHQRSQQKLRRECFGVCACKMLRRNTRLEANTSCRRREEYRDGNSKLKSKTWSCNPTKSNHKNTLA